MHKKVQSLLITGIMSANMLGATVSVFADDKTEQDSNTKGKILFILPFVIILLSLIFI